MAQPTCPNCHTELVVRPNATPEQSWAGAWFVHPPVVDPCTRRNGATLIPSAALRAQQEQAA